MSAKCPHCGEPLRWYNVKAECKHCGVNIMFYTQDASLARDAKRTELESAVARMVIARIKANFIGGKLQIALNNALAALCGIFTVRLSTVGIKCEFNDDKLDYYVSSKVKLRLSTVIAIAVCVVVRYFWFKHKKKRQAKKNITVSQEQTEQKMSA